jgi:hypothetical protein
LGSLVYWGLVAGLGISPFHMLALAGLLMIMITLWICRGGGRVILRASMPT